MSANTHCILTSRVASISSLRDNPSKVIAEAEGGAVAILNRNAPSFYCVPTDMFEAMIDALEDVALGKLVQARQNEEAEHYPDWDKL
ncbi:antitoxin StbD [Modicisalibacter xianhensis]|uniref:Antitoxin n=1 Tax=Modicisalibacter xianhensis TaxID=442341 RepID=A0A4R8FUC9_9GAMM|nr:type II toxin-antitoxin system Phd/YefM family antitoxin [Halomonas xianhensis]TDX29117.1 antitoxin StbD [Halomonas xianhensis]